VSRGLDVKKKILTPGELGHGFEDYVRGVFERNGYALVGQNQWRKNYAPENDRACKREYDLVMYDKSNGQFCIIECKAHYSPQKYVDVGLVKEFDCKLRNNNGIHAVRVMVSDTDFTESAKQYAVGRNIRLVNGNELGRMAGVRASLAGGIENAAYKSLFSGLERVVCRTINKYKP